MGDCSMYTKRTQGQKAMPFVGLYAAAASTICSIAMLLNSMYKQLSFYKHTKTFHFSSKYFALNATWLTLLAVATKLTGDLTTQMPSPRDNLTKISSTAFLTMAMGNFFTTLASMTDKDILINVTALGILVTTVLVNLCIQLSTHVLEFSLFPKILFIMVLLVCTFITIVCSALAVPAIKKRSESKYQTIHNHIQLLEGQQHTVEEMRLSITKYWVMAASASPQFMMTRLATFIYVGCICQLCSFVSDLERFLMDDAFDNWTSHCHQESDYKWSVKLILFSQYFPIIGNLDWYILLRILCSKYENNGIKINMKEFIIESYWTEKLVEWRQSSIPVRINRGRVRKFLHNIKAWILTLCIRLQTVVVMWCKLSCVVFYYTMLPFVFIMYHLEKCIVVLRGSSDEMIDYSCYLILLEGEEKEKFPATFLKNIVDSVDVHIEKGKMKQPKKLLDLLNQSFSFDGVREFDSNRVSSLLYDELPNCWALPIVTLTSIAITLPNIESQHVDWLVSSVDEGLHYVRLIDALDEKHYLKGIKSAADVVWVGVELHKKWLDVDLETKVTGQVNSAKEIIQALSVEAERIVMEFWCEENPLYWPSNVLAANSMYRVSNTILLCYENDECRPEEVFRKLICMIADILAACLTNLSHLIATKCSCNAIEQREKNVREAAVLVGETENILKHFKERQITSIGPDHPLYIDDWRRWMERRIPNISTSATYNGALSTVPYS
ncbi:uncharacterized protein LOC116029911 [Ipomoea triloba]|uniref:uncharacterized protein LOC116029911 n=1 Tax=Ipomoea triloba TaxID=35885 RepID=UPI00125E51BF|nr:uncharacterized protein LOC116029911 [Ipomoea triloba]